MGFKLPLNLPPKINPKSSQEASQIHPKSHLIFDSFFDRCLSGVWLVFDPKILQDSIKNQTTNLSTSWLHFLVIFRLAWVDFGSVLAQYGPTWRQIGGSSWTCWHQDPQSWTQMSAKCFKMGRSRTKVGQVAPRTLDGHSFGFEKLKARWRHPSGCLGQPWYWRHRTGDMGKGGSWCRSASATRSTSSRRKRPR